MKIFKYSSKPAVSRGNFKFIVDRISTNHPISGDSFNSKLLSLFFSTNSSFKVDDTVLNSLAYLQLVKRQTCVEDQINLITPLLSDPQKYQIHISVFWGGLIRLSQDKQLLITVDYLSSLQFDNDITFIGDNWNFDFIKSIIRKETAPISAWDNIMTCVSHNRVLRENNLINYKMQLSTPADWDNGINLCYQKRPDFFVPKIKELRDKKIEFSTSLSGQNVSYNRITQYFTSNMAWPAGINNNINHVDSIILDSPDISSNDKSALNEYSKKMELLAGNSTNMSNNSIFSTYHRLNAEYSQFFTKNKIGNNWYTCFQKDNIITFSDRGSIKIDSVIPIVNDLSGFLKSNESRFSKSYLTLTYQATPQPKVIYPIFDSLDTIYSNK